MLITLLVISVVANVLMGLVVYKALQRATLCEDFCEAVLFRLTQVVADMRSIDIRGSFEADDEVGTIFQAILRLIETLTLFIPEGELDGTTEEG